MGSPRVAVAEAGWGGVLVKVGLLTGGGDCPGLNAAIRAVVRVADQMGWQITGIINGWAGLLEPNTRALDARSVSGILHVGGTILGTSRTNPMRIAGGMDRVARNMGELGLESLIAIGGQDTLGVANQLFLGGGKIVGVPKTMDNDVAGTDYCIGFDSAATAVVEALDRLHTTASAHHRVMVVEVMGRHAGWVATIGGLAGGADYILVPEEPGSLDDACVHLKRRYSSGKDFSIVVVAEGAQVEGLEVPESGPLDAFGHARQDRRGVGERLAAEIERRTGFEARVTVLGYLQRGGSPTVFDRVLATRLGARAVELVRDEQWGMMPVLRGNRIETISIAESVAARRDVDLELYHLAQHFF